jgi:GntR family transcriptional regulator, transcriptional repressor for pyruvate dehydrogenase complex
MKAVERVPIVQQVVESLKNYIITGHLEIGEKLPSEKELCETLSVGRGTLREAIRALEATGYIEMKPGKGAFIASKNHEDIKNLSVWFAKNEVEIIDFLRVRQAIEPLAVRLAIPNCTPEDVRELQNIQQKIIDAATAFDAPTLSLCDEQFHAYIVKCSANKLLISIYNLMSIALREFREKTFFVPSNVKNVVRPHNAILQAFVDRNPEEGEKAMLLHLDLIMNDLEKSKSAPSE